MGGQQHADPRLGCTGVAGNPTTGWETGLTPLAVSEVGRPTLDSHGPSTPRPQDRVWGHGLHTMQKRERSPWMWPAGDLPSLRMWRTAVWLGDTATQFRPLERTSSSSAASKLSRRRGASGVSRPSRGGPCHGRFMKKSLADRPSCLRPANSCHKYRHSLNGTSFCPGRPHFLSRAICFCYLCQENGIYTAAPVCGRGSAPLTEHRVRPALSPRILSAGAL